MIELIGLEVLGDVPHQSASQDLRNVGLDQLRVGRNQCAREVGEQVVDVSAACSRSRPSRAAGRVVRQPAPATPADAGELAVAADRAGPPVTSCSEGIVSVAMTSTSARGPETKEPPPPDFARGQDQGVAAQVPPHSRQGLLHRLGAVGFRSHHALPRILDSQRLLNQRDFSLGKGLRGSESTHGLGLFLDNAAEDLDRRIAWDFPLT